MTFKIHLAQFDVAPICNLIVSRRKICDIALGRRGDLRNVTTCDKDGRGVKNHEIRVT